MAPSLFRKAARRLASPVLQRLDARIAHQTRIQFDALQRESITPLQARTEALLARPQLQQRVLVPPIDAKPNSDAESADNGPFMQYSTPSVADFLHPRFAELTATCGLTPHFHRKQWEHVFILHHLATNGMLAEGHRGLGFGVGSEPLPAVFAASGATVVATDAPVETAVRDGWRDTNEFAESVESLSYPDICDPARFGEAVSYRTVDMNEIPPELIGFDFCWSACCFEHLGSLQHGAQFVINSVEQCLRPGGVAVHTTEINLSSNTDTLESPALSIYRQRDLIELVGALRDRGHTVQPLMIAPQPHVLDHFVDLPPFHGDLHIKLELAGYASTSVGLVITRG